MIKWREIHPLTRISLSKRMMAPVKMRGQSVIFSLPCTPDVTPLYRAPPPTPAGLSRTDMRDGDSSSSDNWDMDYGSSDAFEEDTNSYEVTKSSESIAHNTDNSKAVTDTLTDTISDSSNSNNQEINSSVTLEERKDDCNILGGDKNINNHEHSSVQELDKQDFAKNTLQEAYSYNYTKNENSSNSEQVYLNSNPGEISDKSESIVTQNLFLQNKEVFLSKLPHADRGQNSNKNTPQLSLSAASLLKGEERVSDSHKDKTIRQNGNKEGKFPNGSNISKNRSVGRKMFYSIDSFQGIE